MILFITALVSGLVIGLILAVIFQQSRHAGETPPGWQAWLILLLGLISLGAFGLGMLNNEFISRFITAGIFLPVAALVVGVDGLAHKDRRWQVWTGFVFSLIPVLFWVAFAIGEVMFPH